MNNCKSTLYMYYLPPYAEYKLFKNKDFISLTATFSLPKQYLTHSTE